MEAKIITSLDKEVLSIVVSGNLDAKSAPKLSDELKQVIGKPVKEIVFNAKELQYISSAGLRVLIFAKQKLGEDVKIKMVGANEEVMDVIKMSGLDNILEFA